MVLIPEKKFGNDSAGYGICQWTYYSRKYDLYDYAQDKDKSIGNMSMQLLFMKRELTSSQISKLKSFDNSAQGAYDAAAYFCSSYERPANTEAQSKKRGNLAKDTYWKRYKGSVTTSSASKKNYDQRSNPARQHGCRGIFYDRRKDHR